MIKSLSEVKVGSNLVLVSNHGRGYRIVTVERLTATMIVLTNDYRFNRTTGFRIGGGDDTLSVEPADFERAAMEHAAMLIRDGAKLTRIDIERMRTALDHAEKVLQHYGKWD